MTLTYGVHSEAGELRRVLVHKSSAAMARLTRFSCDEQLFENVICVRQVRIEHMTFVDAMRNRGVEVVFLRQLLADTMTPSQIDSHELPPGPMGPKASPSATFIRDGGKLADIGQLTDACAILNGNAEARILPEGVT